MKNFLQILLIGFSMALCGLIAFQWIRETDLRKNVQKLTDTVQDKTEVVMNQEAALKNNRDEIQRLDALKNELKEAVKTNFELVTTLSAKLEDVTNELGGWQKQTDVYKEALQKANDSINRQNEDIRKQNEDLKKMAEDRNELVGKFNKVAGDYNDLVGKWNKQQEDLAKASTNQPAAGKK